ncbi:MAG: hypothetical protein AAF725_11140 [Acidobacteriota bacterium]
MDSSSRSHRDPPPSGLKLSTRDLRGLPGLDGLRALSQSLATLDAILCPEWEFRYFSFNNFWDEGEKLGLMRNGEGDDYLISFNAEGAIIKGFVHNCPMASGAPWSGILDGVPEVFTGFLEEPAFSRDATTFCVWRLAGEDAWRVGEIDFPEVGDPDGSEQLLRFLDGRPETYKEWGDEYYGQPLDVQAIDRIYRHVPLSPGLVARLNPEVDFRELADELDEIGYPLA